MKKVFLIALALYWPLSVQAAILEGLPFRDVHPFNLTRGYNTPDTHVGKEKFALDFAQAGCEAYQKPAAVVSDGAIEQVNNRDPSRKGGGGFGFFILVKHRDGTYSRYAHLDKVLVTNGAVSTGEVIGLIGATGNVSGKSCPEHQGTHLHFVMYDSDGSAYKPEPIEHCQEMGSRNPSCESFTAGKWYLATLDPEELQFSQEDDSGQNPDIRSPEYARATVEFLRPEGLWQTLQWGAHDIFANVGSGLAGFFTGDFLAQNSANLFDAFDPNVFIDVDEGSPLVEIFRPLVATVLPPTTPQDEQQASPNAKDTQQENTSAPPIEIGGSNSIPQGPQPSPDPVESKPLPEEQKDLLSNSSNSKNTGRGQGAGSPPTEASPIETAPSSVDTPEPQEDPSVLLPPPPLPPFALQVLTQQDEAFGFSASSAKVAYSPQEDVFLFVWKRFHYREGGTSDLVGQRFGTHGEPLDAQPFLITGSERGEPQDIHVVFGHGSFLVTWYWGPSDDPEVWTGIAAARVVPSGDTVTVRDVELIRFGRQHTLAVVSEGFLLVWRGAASGGGVSGGGTEYSGALINFAEEGSPRVQTYPLLEASSGFNFHGVACQLSGECLLFGSWRSYGEVFFPFTTTNLQGGEFREMIFRGCQRAETCDQPFLSNVTNPTMLALNGSAFLVAWEDVDNWDGTRYGLRLQRLDLSGKPQLSSELLPDTTIRELLLVGPESIFGKSDIPVLLRVDSTLSSFFKATPLFGAETMSAVSRIEGACGNSRCAALWTTMSDEGVQKLLAWFGTA